MLIYLFSTQRPTLDRNHTIVDTGLGIFLDSKSEAQKQWTKMKLVLSVARRKCKNFNTQYSEFKFITHYKEYANTRRYFFIAASSCVFIYDDLTTKNEASKTKSTNILIEIVVNFTMIPGLS